MAIDDFSFAWDGADGSGAPWDQLRVLHFEGHEEISGLYRYDLTLIADSADQEVDPADLVHRRATLRIKTLSAPAFKVVHGVIVEARELAVAQKGGQPYHVVLMPPLVRARFRRRSRIFLDKTLRQIVEAVLTGDPLLAKVDGGAAVEDDDGLPTYAPAAEQLAWRILDASRLDDARVRGYCVQYNESDLDFVARLLEEEGIGYHFENGAGTCLLVLSDHDGGRARLHPDTAIGVGVPGRGVSSFGLGAALRTEGVVLDDYNWKKPSLDMTARAGAAGGLVEVGYPGGYPDSPAQGTPLARAMAERYRTEASHAHGEGTARMLSAGSIFTLEHPESRYDGEYLVTDLRVRGDHQGFSPIPGQPGTVFYAWYQCARRGTAGAAQESRFRPARRTPRPRIAGAQTAVVTAEPGSSSEVNVDGPDGLSIGCVRLKFHWDDDSARHAKEPTSCWVRVSQGFAGAGQGAVWHPRVGVECVVEFEEGNPDRPIVTGRVYNGQNLPPHGGSPVHSTHKSFSTPGGGTWNEITFNDTAGSELVYVHAGKDETTNVNHDRLEDVGNDATMTVGNDNTENIGANCTLTVGANDTVTIGANQTNTIGANSTTTVGGNSDKTVGANESFTVGGDLVIDVASSLTETVGGAVTEDYGSTMTTTVSGAETQTGNATRTVTVAAKVDQQYGSHTLTVNGFRFIGVMGTQSTKTGGAVTEDYTGSLLSLIFGSHTTKATGPITRNCPFYVVIMPLKTDIDWYKGTVSSSISLGITGVSLNLTGASLAFTAVKLGLTGLSFSYTGVTLKPQGVEVDLVLATMSTTAIYVCLTGFALLL